MRTDLLLDEADDLLLSGRAGRAATLLAPVVDEEPDNVVAWLLLARARFALGQSEAALEAARSALRLEPDGTEALFWVSAAYTVLGRHELAITAAASACAEDPGHPRLTERHGRALLAAGRVAEAEAVLRSGAEYAAYDADLQVAHGIALLAAARPLSAREAHSRALTLDPAHERAQAELRRLASVEQKITDADSLIRATDEFAESLRVPAGGVRRPDPATGVLAHVSAVVFAVCLIALLGMAVAMRTTSFEPPTSLLLTLICTAASAGCLTTLTRRWR